MKRSIYLIAAALIVLASCESKKSEATAETTKGTGYILDSSANIEMVKKINTAFLTNDSATVFAAYTDGAKVHDNLNAMSIKENFRMIKALQASGIVMKFDKFNAIWESILYKADQMGVTDYVDASVMLTATKGGKSTTVVMSQVFAIKDGKVIEEYDTYDTKGLNDIMK